MTLPVGLDLTDRRVVVVGGGPAALPGIVALVDAQAAVHVIAPWVCEDAAALVATGEVAWTERDYAGSVDLDGAWLALAASGDVAVDEAVRADAVATRLWCLDATAALPATARVSTPDGTVDVAVHAGNDAVLARGVARSVGGLLAGGQVDTRRRTRRTGAGWVALVGGGPGDDGLLTVRGRELLASADVVVLDRLAPRAVVDALPADVQVIDVGKSPGRHALPRSGSTTCSSTSPSPAGPWCASRAATPTSSVGAARNASRARRKASGSRSCPG